MTVHRPLFYYYRILTLIVATAAAGGVGYGLGAASVPVGPPPRATDDSEVVHALHEVMARIDRLENAIVNRPAATERHEVPRPADAPAPPDDRVDAAIEKLTALAERISVAQGSAANETLRRSLQQRPDPDFAKLLAFRQALVDEKEQENPDPHRSVQRPWILRTAAEVAEEFGAPSKAAAFTGNFDMNWTYLLPGEVTLDFYFRNGLVFLIDF